jgi:hypothetical protein
MPLRAKLPSAKSEEKKTKNLLHKLHGLSLDVSILVFSTLSDAAKAAPVPYLQQSAALVLGILVVIQVRGL